MGVSEMFPFFQNDCTPPICGVCQNTGTLTAHTEVEDHPSRWMNESDEYDRCGHDTRQLHPSSTDCRRTANLPRPTILVNMVFKTHCCIFKFSQ